jgi:hypothetical protein
MIRVLNCSIDEELQALRHLILAQLEAVEVFSPRPGQAVSIIRSQKLHVLVVCCQLDDTSADSLSVEFRRANPQGRIIGIVSASWNHAWEADVLVDTHSPRALVTAVSSYPAMQSQFKHKRRLVLVTTDKWTGWACERCCWNRPQSADVVLDKFKEETIQKAFDSHSCEAFARETWLPPVATSHVQWKKK